MQGIELLDVINRRYSCRSYDPDRTIGDEDLGRILEAARMAPTSYGFEPWRALVIGKSKNGRGERLREQLLPIVPGAQNGLRNASHFVILLARGGDDMRAGSPYLRHMTHDIKGLSETEASECLRGFSEFQRDDLHVLDNDRALFDWTGKQAYIVLENLLLAAAALGVDSCAVEGFDADKVNELLEREGLIDTNVLRVCVMACLGYHASDAMVPAKVRQPLDDLIVRID